MSETWDERGWDEYDEEEPYEEDDEDDEDFFDCALDRNGNCGKAGSEECEFECPYNHLVRN